ncbi:MAG: flagellar hook capping protein [Phycisphaerae bacterium]|nr:flagellar hook capping protein [Phycisphaerae bacterium]
MDSIAGVGTSTASDIQMDYMQLLVTQLQNQNPLEPLDNNEMASQLAQFSQLQQLESMNTSFSDVLSSIERAYAASLIGKEVSFVADDGSGSGEITAGVVEQVFNNIDGKIVLVADGRIISLQDIVSIKN